VISELSLVAPTFRVVRLADGRFNFSDLIDEFAAQPASDAPTPLFSLNNIQISGGKIDFDDQMLGEKHQLSELNIGLPFISSLPQATAIFVEPTFSASIDGSPLLAQGKSKPFDASMESEWHSNCAMCNWASISITCRMACRSRSFPAPLTAI
jgi:uncharacterized protein involved in outer membrane biogenesis